jgi:hypothetical protein
VGESALLPAHETDSLSTELSRHVVETLAPDEIPFFVDAVKDFHDHRSIEPGSRSRDEPLGFGAEFSLLAPYVITVMPTIINFLAGVLSSIAQEEIATGLGPMIRGLFKGGGQAENTAPATLTAEQGRQVREITRTRAIDVGLDQKRAALLADAVVGALSIAGSDDHR